MSTRDVATLGLGAALERAGVIPVVVVSSAEQGVRLAEALLAGGIDTVEVTFRSNAATAAIAAITQRFPEAVVGAGSLLTESDVQAAVDAGAVFGVAPGTSAPVVRAAQAAGLPFAPGIATPTELEEARRLGATAFKLFPAEVVGGLALIDALAGPYPDALFMPTGGIRESNLADYLAHPRVAACGGTWIAPTSLLAEERYDEITRRARAASDIVRHARPLSRKEDR